MATALHRLEAEPVLVTVERLRERVAARFPGRGLERVATELVTMTQEVSASAAVNRGRLRALRAGSRTLVLLVLVATVTALAFVLHSAIVDGPDHEVEWLSLLESGVNDVVFASIAIWFLYSVPERVRRADTLALLHKLRSLAHIIDMHQLAKDPERLRSSFRPTPVSPAMDLGPGQLEHYLDYCSEMLSLVGKVAALCAEESRDAIVLDTVSTIETLTTGMSRKIWQKISVLNEARPAD
ncbi:hypothetical protein [Nocardioides panacisoli]|uniref:Uncharacterized protein n=1 Tax=Nocardioides panacisoli TaxID=627624 RepID=A0ABP7HUS7_9ACTN